jgi:hypothetical protein
MLMGWGAGNPEPAPGVFDFTSLDARIGVIRSTGATPVITLCGAPDWMKGGLPGHTDWSKLEVAPLPQYYAAFAQLAVAVAQRYPDVRDFQVWNEMKGFWDASRNRWNYEAYTAFYNTVYDALKAYDPTLRVGGPYVVMSSYVGRQSNPSAISGAWGTLDQRPLDVITYWLAHKHGADFVAVDGSTAPRDAAQNSDPFAGVAKLTAITTWLKTQTSLPIWWSELYTGPTTDPEEAAAITSSSLMALADAGASVALLWQEPHPGVSVGPCLWTDTRQANGGQLTPTGTAVLALNASLASDAALHEIGALPVGVVGYAVNDHAVLINTAPGAETVVAPAGRVAMARYATAVVSLH